MKCKLTILDQVQDQQNEKLANITSTASPYPKSSLTTPPPPPPIDLPATLHHPTLLHPHFHYTLSPTVHTHGASFLCPKHPGTNPNNGPWSIRKVRPPPQPEGPGKSGTSAVGVTQSPLLSPGGKAVESSKGVAEGRPEWGCREGSGGGPWD